MQVVAVAAAVQQSLENVGDVQEVGHLGDGCHVVETKSELGSSSFAKRVRRKFQECWLLSCYSIANACGNVVLVNLHCDCPSHGRSLEQEGSAVTYLIFDVFVDLLHLCMT